MTNKIVILGANSFLGIHLCRELCRQDKYETIAIVRTDVARISLHTELEGLNTVFLKSELLANLTDCLDSDSVVINCLFDRKSGVETNLRIFSKIIEKVRSKNVKKFIHISSVDVYGRNPAMCIDESMKCNPVTEYSRTKYSLEKLTSDYSGRDFPVVVLRAGAIFGEGGNNLFKHAYDSLNRSLFYNYIKIFLHGKRSLNLVCVENVVAAIIHIANKTSAEPFSLVNVTDDDESINNYFDVINIIRKHASLEALSPPVMTLPVVIMRLLLKIKGKDNTNPFREYSNAKLLNEGFAKKTNLEKAIREYVDSFRTCQR